MADEPGTVADVIAGALEGEAGEGDTVAPVVEAPVVEAPVEGVTPAVETPPEVLPPAPSRPFSLIDGEGAALEDPGSVTLQNLLDGEASVAFKAKGEEQTASLEKLVSMAQRQIGQGQRLDQERTDHKATHKALNKALEAQDGAVAQKALLLKILKDPTGEEFKKAANEFSGGEGLATVGSVAEPAAPPAPVDPTDPYDVNSPSMQAGANVVREIIQPRAEALAEAYGADPQEVMQAIVQAAGEVVPSSFTVDRLAEIMNEDIVGLLEESGYVSEAGVADWTAPDSPARSTNGLTRAGERKVSGGDQALVEENTRLKAQLEAAKTGDVVKAVSDSPPSPDSGPGGDAPTGDFNLDKAESMDDVRKELEKLVQ